MNIFSGIWGEQALDCGFGQGSHRRYQYRRLV
jgi:hypothetical protein